MATDLIQDNYEFNAPPRVVQKQKYRDTPSDQNNIMWDKRVIRGNTYSSSINKQPETVVKMTVVRRAKQANITEKSEDQQIFHQETQTDPNVEELTDKPPRHTRDTQTEFVIEKIVPRLYMKQKTGIDVHTQVWDDGELFNFEYEVEPILQVLVLKTLDLSRMEVLQEEELRDMKQQQEHFHRLKQAELAEQDRLEKKEQQLYNQNIKLKQQYHHQKQKDIRTHEKLVSRVLSKQFLRKVNQNALNYLINAGLFRDEVESELIIQYLPWLYEGIGIELLSLEDVHIQFDSILVEQDQQLITTHKTIIAVENQRRQEIWDGRAKDKKDKEEFNQQRRERRKIRLEKERRQRIKEQIIEQLVAKGEEKDALQMISDIDGNSQGTQYLGFFGGIIGEFIILINALLQLGQQIDIPDFVQSVLAGLPETTIVELGLKEAIDQQLIDIDPELTLATLPEVLTPQIISAISSNVTYSMGEHISNTGLQQIDLITKNVIKTLIEMRARVKFVKVKGTPDLQKLPCLIRMIPSLHNLNFHPKSGKSRPQVNPEDEATEEEIINPINLAEAQVENRATAFVSQSEEISTVVIHCVSELYFRQVAMTVLEELELQILIDVTDKCTTIQNEILDSINPSLPIIEINQY